MPETPTMTAVIVGILIAVFLGAIGGATAGAPAAQSIDDCAASPDGFATPDGGDAIGYVDGYWYDQPIVLAPDGANDSTTNATLENDSMSIPYTSNDTAANGSERPPMNASDGVPLDVSDGLSDRELSAVVARTAARVEAVRCRSFTSVPTVEVANRLAVRASESTALANRSVALRRYDDARLATALLLGDQRNSTAARIATTGASSLGYYVPATDRIVVVSENDTAVRIDEPTLAHELTHALQDQLFDLGRFDANRTDVAMAESGLIEGDASLVEQQYQDRCDAGSWGPDCLDANPGTTGNTEFYGLELFFFQPYNSGPRYVEDLYETGGWSAVDAEFEAPPRSTAPILTPDAVRGSQPANATFRHPVTDPDWRRLAPPTEPRADRLGPGTIGAAMIAPTFDPDADSIYSGQRVINDAGRSRLDPLTPYEYGVDATTGWRGDRLEVYQNADGETATRWRTVWESERAAAVFRERYVQLLDRRGAETAAAFVGTYNFLRESAYSGLVSVRQNGTAVVVTRGQTVPTLRTLDRYAAQDPQPGSTSSMDQSDDSKRNTEDALPGPGALGALLAVAIAVILLAVVRLRDGR